MPGRRSPMTGGRRRRAGAALVVLTGLSGVACDADSREEASASPSVETTSPSVAEPSPTTSPAVPTGIAITTSDSDYGRMLFDLPGQAIYLFEKETTGRPDCYGECATAWPPVLTSGIPQAAGDVRTDLLGTVTRDDGSTQVTYAGHPLYYYAHEGPGEVLCHDVVEYGGRWLVVTPAGAPAP